jgi:hypothetical protein
MALLMCPFAAHPITPADAVLILCVRWLSSGPQANELFDEVALDFIAVENLG